MSRLRTCAVAAALAVAAVASACAGTEPSPKTLSWHDCEPALAAVARSVGTDAALHAQCASLTVPLLYSNPDGRTITLAVSRVHAASGRKRGILLVNPGGPGLEGRSMPLYLTKTSGLSDWDIVGVDIRGNGASTHSTCTAVEDLDIPAGDDSLTGMSQVASTYVQGIATANRQCSQRDGQLLASLTPNNAADDLDRVRAALGADRVSYFGGSWGTVLGLAYRTLHPERIETMVLDSPDYLGMSIDEQNRDLAQAVAHASAARVSTTTPETSPPVDDPTPPSTPDTTPPPQLAPLNYIARSAYTCNTLDRVPDAATQWTTWVSTTRAAGLPAADRLPNPSNSEIPGASLCSGWPTPGQRLTVKDTDAPLLLIGHRSETVTPYQWAITAHQQAGGVLYTVDDDEHASTLSTSCSAPVTAFLGTGATPPPTCAPTEG